ncbi:allantoinase AllB [Halalkalibacterium halodurans]|nr:allantoinase AllB [Halalkalibacterium halodurans]
MSVKQLMIKNGTVYTDGTFKRAHVIVHKGLVEQIILSKTEVDESNFLKVVDASDSYVLPGFIDSHVHFNDPGREEWEGFYSGSRAAAAGGTTTVFDMPLNSSPSVTNTHILEMKKKHVSSRSWIHYGLWGGITAANVGDEEELKGMKEAGVIGFKAFLSDSGIGDFEKISKDQLKEAMIKAKKLDAILALHAEDQDLIEHYTAQLLLDKRTDRQAFLNSRPPSAELAAITDALKKVEQTKVSVHFVHVSSPLAIELINQYKENGFDVSVEVCPHYLLFDEQDFLNVGPLLKCAPPLRSRDMVEELWKCVERGWVDIIGTDHSPCPIQMKSEGDQNIWKAWGGIQGIQFGFQFFLQEAMKRGFSIEKLIPLLTSNVAKRFGLSEKKGDIQAGYDADLTIVKMNRQWSVNKSNTYTRHPYSPYEKLEATSKIMATVVSGDVIYENDQFIERTKEPMDVSAFSGFS